MSTTQDPLETVTNLELVAKVYADDDASVYAVELAVRLENADAEIQYLREQVLALTERVLKDQG